MVTAPVKFKVWKRIRLGTGLTDGEDFRGALRDCGCSALSDSVNMILEGDAFRTAIATKETEIDLVKISVAELGFEQGATRDAIHKKALELGLELCPSEIGPQLRLQYVDQPMQQMVIIGMEPIVDSGGGVQMFFLGRFAFGLWLDSYRGDVALEHIWPPDFQWVFVLPRK